MDFKRLTGVTLALLIMPFSASADDSLNGKALYEANCSACHGTDGTATEFGKSLKPFPARDHKALAGLVERDELRRIITYGINGTDMTPKKYDLDGLQIEAVIDYMQTFSYKPNLANGKTRFEAVCASCHGIDGRAQTGMGAKNLVYSELTLQEMAHTMRYGRPGTKMTSKRHQLSNEDIADVANYAYSLRYKADAAKGKTLYANNCASCHTTPSEIKMTGNAASKTQLSNLSDRLLDLRIRHGRHVDRAGKHVAKLSADDIQDIIAHMRKSTK
ncbi:Cytochrome C oxidase, cbb3-type, subunit III [Mariprofundus ferrinatatus]|uniref:Cytochrome C oxidase, cbb3-type, subunit III n=1 Tax=Mariprofundus ferrinatatus TaxID=1921087 RepID=A0A2K8L3P5_9PROT|nr:cytochrome c [Mariprofundus ferrinatatus]ATX81950.1 Cytochrome C oxidase, cbb3-type, subunit III [Mariprofundus ferrinatatus]